MRKVRDLMDRVRRGEATRAEIADARQDLEAMVRRVERVSRLGGGDLAVELSPYMRSVLKIAREPEAPASATARRAANF